MFPLFIPELPVSSPTMLTTDIGTSAVSSKFEVDKTPPQPRYYPLNELKAGLRCLSLARLGDSLCTKSSVVALYPSTRCKSAGRGPTIAPRLFLLKGVLTISPNQCLDQTNFLIVAEYCNIQQRCGKLVDLQTRCRVWKWKCKLTQQPINHLFAAHL